MNHLYCAHTTTKEGNRLIQWSGNDHIRSCSRADDSEQMCFPHHACQEFSCLQLLLPACSFPLPTSSSSSSHSHSHTATNNMHLIKPINTSFLLITCPSRRRISISVDSLTPPVTAQWSFLTTVSPSSRKAPFHH
jgi:hypothetical protein